MVNETASVLPTPSNSELLFQLPMISVESVVVLLQDEIMPERAIRIRAVKIRSLIFCIYMFFFSANIFLKRTQENVKGIKADKTRAEKDSFTAEKKS